MLYVYTYICIYMYVYIYIYIYTTDNCDKKNVAETLCQGMKNCVRFVICRKKLVGVSSFLNQI